MAENENTLTVVDEDGIEYEYKVLFSFESVRTGKNYMVYTDCECDAQGNMHIYASAYDSTGKNDELMPIESDEEWEEVQGVLSDFQNRFQKNDRNREGM